MRRNKREQTAGKRTPVQLELDWARHRKELAEARENGEASKIVQALNNLGTVRTDQGRHEEALDYYEQAVAALADDCSVEEQVVSRGNAAQAARQLERWEASLDYALQAEALAMRHKYKKTLNEFVVSFLALRRALGAERFAELFTERLALLPEDQRAYVRTDLHLNPTYKKDPTAPRRNDPCPCGSGKKYKKCCGRQ